jgi:hypothetical protein
MKKSQFKQDDGTLPPPATPVNDDPNRPRHMQEFCGWFGKSKRSVQRAMKNRGLPYIDLGTPAFHLPTVIEWMKRNQRNLQ